MADAGEPTGRWIRFRSWCTGTFVWWLLIIPALQYALVQYLSREDLLFFRESSDVKRIFELIHPSLLFLTVLVALQGWRLTGRFTFGWLAMFAFCMLCREIHFEGSSLVMVVGCLALLVVAVRRNAERRAFLQRRWTCSFYFMGLICYLISQLLDRGIVKHFVRFVLDEPKWKIYYSSNIEESLESLGGLFQLLALFCL